MVWSFLTTGKEALHALLNRFLAPYVENMDTSQLQYGVWQGQLSLRGLKLKKEALDKFRLPVDVLEGYVGTFTLTIPWQNITGKPVEVFIEDVYLLAVPAAENAFDAAEDEDRKQATKQERLNAVEIMRMKGQASDLSNKNTTQQQQGLIESMTTRIINNVQITVKNIHIRYEDSISAPGHPFSAGVTLAGFTATSVNENWVPTFIQDTKGGIHKLASLESLSAYFNTDMTSMAGMPFAEAMPKYKAGIAHSGQTPPDHQFILKPVTGQGRIIMNPKFDSETPKNDVQLLFDEIGFVIDDDQYRDAISMVDMYHFYLRQQQYRALKPSDEAIKENKARAMLQFAGQMILREVHDKHYKWTWEHFAKRRDDRKRYIELFKKKETDKDKALTGEELAEFEGLERKLVYEDIRFYRSIARSELRKERASRKAEEEAHPPVAVQTTSKGGGWTSWLLGGGKQAEDKKPEEEEDTLGLESMSDEQRKELYQAIDYDEKAALAASFETPRDAMNLRISAQLKRGSFALRSSQAGTDGDMILVVFDAFRADVIQRPDSMDAVVMLGGFGVHDGTQKGSIHPQIVRVKESHRKSKMDEGKTVSAHDKGSKDNWDSSLDDRGSEAGDESVHDDDEDDEEGEPEKEEEKEEETEDPFLYIKFENNPLDERADTGLTVRMRYMEIVYHRGYVEAIYRFLKPPESQLESVGALLNAAGETLEGLRKETRAGLEYALQQHKTIDVKMDLQAPIIIIPEDVTAKQCQHVILDAGHISIESELVSKNAMKDIDAKKKKQYTDDDYTHLESLMYDRFSVKLHSAQLLLGNDLEVVLAGLNNDHSNAQELHLLERINLDFAVQNTIVPDAVNLAKFKVSGKLPELQVNLSNQKYKGIMRIIDVAIPKFGDDTETAPASKPKAKPEKEAARPPPLPLPTNVFSRQAEYAIQDVDAESTGDTNEDFFEANDGEAGDLQLHQHVVEFSFEVEKLQASLYKTAPDGTEKLLANTVLEGFALQFAMAKFNMDVDVKLRSIGLNMITDEQNRMQLLTSNQGEDGNSTPTDLVSVKYVRAQKESPEFASVYNGIDQSVEVALSTFTFHVAPEPVLTLYDFIMSTFVGGNEASTTAPTPVASGPGTPQIEQPPPLPEDSGKIKVKVKLTSVRLLLMNVTSIATLVLPSADVEVLLRPGSMLVEAKLGQLSLSDDSEIQTHSKDFKQLLTIEGDDLAKFKYETFDPTEPNFDGINSFVHLRAGSLKFTFMEEPLRDIYAFMIKFARLKSLYDTATQAAVQRASEIQRMKFDVIVQSPILIFPCDAATSEDVMIVKLGEIVANNEYVGDDGRITAGLRGIRLSSELSDGSRKSKLRVMEDVDITASIEQYSNVDRSANPNKPDTFVDIKMSDIRVALTQTQFCILMNLSRSVPAVLASASEAENEANLSSSNMLTVPTDTPAPATPEETGALVDLGPEVSMTAVDQAGKKIDVWTTLDLVFTCHAVKLHLYDQNASHEQNLKECGISRFALVDNIVRYKTLSDGASEAEVVLKSLTMSNTRPGPSKFREIIPAAQHDRNQFMILYSTSGGPKPSGRAIVTVDSPKIIFSMEPVFALVDFFTSPFAAALSPESTDESPAEELEGSTPQQSSELAYRVDIHDLSVSVLENDADSHSQAIHLSVKEVSTSQQAILALTVNQLGMSLGLMGRASESVRFLDDMDITLSLDSRQSAAHQMTSIELATQPIVFRASYRDINLIMAIVNRAIELSSKPQAKEQQPEGRPDALSSVSSAIPPSSQRKPPPSRSRVPVRRASHRSTSGAPKLMMSKEKLKATFDGFRLVLIGDLHELPMFHLKTKPFEVAVSDWSGELKATTTFGTSINYWNLVNSHWEPLIDPWTFSISAIKEETDGTLTATLASKERLDLNITSAFVELAINTMTVWQQKGDQVLQRARGGDAPYRIRNRTGDVIHVWSDQEASTKGGKTPQSVKIGNEETVDWRFDDWKAMREHVSVTRAHLIGVQFQGKAWEPVKGIPVDREGEFVYGLRPNLDKLMDRLLCEITVQDNVKVITLRSTYNVENLTSYPIELILVDSANKPAYAVQKIAPGQQYSLPIEAVTKNRIKLRPDAGFGFAFSQQSLAWEDLVKRPNVTVSCRYNEGTEAPFRFQVFAKYDSNDPITRRYPKMNLRVRPPIELENLLPYDLNYRIYDKNTSQNWSSFLRRGGIMPVHSVELTHLVLLNVEVQDSGFKPSSFAIINADADADFDIEKVVSLPDKDGRKLDLRLNYVRHPDSGGAMKVQIYSPFIMINKTGLPFNLRAARSSRGTTRDVAVGDSSAMTKPTPFMFSHLNKGGNEFAISVAGSAWSTVVNFESLRTETEIVMRGASKNEEMHIGLSWAEGLGKYKLSKVVTLAPRFIVKNMTERQLSFREHGVALQNGSTLESGQQAPLTTLRSGMEGLLTFAYSGLNAKWSSPINIQDIGRVHLRMPTAENEQHHKPHLLRADVALEGGTIFVILSRETGPWPFKIDNQSDYQVTISQMDTTRLERGDQPQGTAQYDVKPHHQDWYAWDAPAAREKKIRLVINGHAKHVDINEIGNLPPFQFPAQPRGNRTVSLDVKAEGPSQTLTISNYFEERSVYKRKNRAGTGTLQRQDTMSSQEAFEAVTAKATVGLIVKVDLEGLGLSLINKRMVELSYLSVDGVTLQYTDTDAAQICDLSLKRLQIDNQLHDCQFPIVLQPTLISQDANALPAIQASLMVLKDNSHGVTFIKYASVLLQSLSIQLDEDFLFTLLDFAKLEGVAWGSEPQDVFTEHPVDIPEPDNLNQGGQDLYFEVLELQPTELSLSFMRSAHTNVEESDKVNTRNPVAVVINAMTMALGNLNDAPLRFNSLGIRDMRLSIPVLQERIIYHYRQEVLRQLYRVLGSADFLGNPVGLFTNVSGGVADIFYEPYKGVVMHGNKELGIGIAKGAASFVKKTVFGVTDSMTKVTSSIGKGLSAATFDEEYQRQRRLAQRTNKPKHAIYGVTAGAEALAASLASGVEGVVMKPIEGAETGGASGFFKGVGKGLVGAVTKPVIGVFDLAANVTEGIRNTTTVFDNNQSERARKPRHVPADGILVAYSPADALGQMWMRDLDGGRFRNEFYVAHIDLPGGDTVAMLTTSRIICFSVNKLRLEWEMPFSYLQGVTIEDAGIRFTGKSGHEHDRFVPIPKSSPKKWFFHEIEKVVKNYSASKRIER